MNNLFHKKPIPVASFAGLILLIALVGMLCASCGEKTPDPTTPSTQATEPTDATEATEATSATEETEPIQGWAALLPTAMEEDGRVVMPTGVPEDEPPENATPLTQEEIENLNTAFQPELGYFAYRAAWATVEGGDYTSPRELPIGSFLCRGMGVWANDEEELAALPWEHPVAVWKITGQQLDEQLMTYFDTTLEKTEKRDMEQVYYREDTDTYYYFTDEKADEKVWVSEGYRDSVGVIYLDVYIQLYEPQQPAWFRVMMLPNAQGRYYIYSVRQIHYKTKDMHILPGTELEYEELRAFDALFAPSGEASHKNYYNSILFCGSLVSDGFTQPEDANLKLLFNAGFWENGSSLSLTEEEQAFIESHNMGKETPVIKRPVAKMDQVLQDYLGITFEQSHKVGLTYDRYFADTETYFGYSQGAVMVSDFAMLHGTREEDGTVHLICLMGTTAKLTLRPTPEGAAQPYYVVACYEVEPCR